MKARIQNGYVVEILVALPGHAFDACFHPELLEQCVDVGNLKVGDPWPPVANPEPVEVPPEPIAEAPVSEFQPAAAEPSAESVTNIA